MPPTDRTVSTTINLRLSQLEALDRLVRQGEQSKSQFVRDALDRALNKRREESPAGGVR